MIVKRIGAALALVAMLALAGCKTPDDGSPGTFSTTTVKVGDRTIPCITWRSHDAGGLSCDWATPATR